MVALFVPTEQQKQFVSQSIKAGFAFYTIADALKITMPTFNKHFQYEKLVSRIELVNKAVGVVEGCLDDDNLDAAKFVLARRSDSSSWSDKKAVELTGKDGADLPPTIINIVSADDESNC